METGDWLNGDTDAVTQVLSQSQGSSERSLLFPSTISAFCVVELGPFEKWCVVMFAIKWARRIWKMLVYKRCWDLVNLLWDCSHLWLILGIWMGKSRTQRDSLPKARNPVLATMRKGFAWSLVAIANAERLPGVLSHLPDLCKYSSCPESVYVANIQL